MIKTLRTTQAIVLFRLVRPVLDCALLGAGLFSMLYLHNLEHEQELNQKPNLQIPHRIQPTKSLYIEKQFSSESDLWQAWNTWIQQNRPHSGQCLIETKANLDEHPFYLLCFGEQRPGNNKAPEFDLLVDKTLFVKPGKPAAIEVEKTTGDTPTPTHKVQGWMITKQGQKNFDPTQDRWTP